MGNYIKREIEAGFLADLFQGKVIILTGPRQVGKTTFIKEMLKDKSGVVSFNGDNPTDRANLENKDLSSLIQLAGKSNIIFIDEAQKIFKIGDTLKLLVDHFGKSMQIIATGSSSLNLLSNTEEPLTGRKFVYEMFGFSVREINPELSDLELEKQIPQLLIYGSYPGVYLEDVSKKERLLLEISESYLYKDILELEQVKNPATLSKLLTALGLQIGSDVSLAGLADITGLDVKTVERYIDLLEKNYVIFRLPPYYTNQRKTLSKQNKIYFYDLGIRNALINNFNALEMRNDIGELWENFLILERLKYRNFKNIHANQYFWRTYDGAEIDLVEQIADNLNGYEFKWKKERTSPQGWLDYPNASFKLINKNNAGEFLLRDSKAK